MKLDTNKLKVFARSKIKDLNNLNLTSNTLSIVLEPYTKLLKDIDSIENYYIVKILKGHSTYPNKS